MIKRYGKLLPTAIAATATAAIAATGIMAAAAAPRTAPAVSGTEHLQFMTTSATSNTSTVIATGVFTAGGAGGTGRGPLSTLTFPHGTVKIRHSRGTGSQHFNPRTCLLTADIHGTYRVLGGTGRYAGITGHGTYQLNLLAVAARVNGKCSMRRPPAAFEQVIRASGPVTLP